MTHKHVGDQKRLTYSWRTSATVKESGKTVALSELPIWISLFIAQSRESTDDSDEYELQGHAGREQSEQLWLPTQRKEVLR